MYNLSLSSRNNFPKNCHCRSLNYSLKIADSFFLLKNLTQIHEFWKVCFFNWLITKMWPIVYRPKFLLLWATILHLCYLYLENYFPEYPKHHDYHYHHYPHRDDVHHHHRHHHKNHHHYQTDIPKLLNTKGRQINHITFFSLRCCFCCCFVFSPQTNK